jgi:hypothetical protein
LADFQKPTEHQPEGEGPMFGFSTPATFSRIVPRRAATRTALALAAASAAFLVIGSAANAQDCVGGYYMLKNEIPVRCDTRAMFTSPTAVAPLHNGTISRTELPANAARPSYSPAAPAAASTNSTAVCQNGMRFVDTAANGYTLMIPCGG